MINKEILEIALNTENYGNLKNHTHHSSLKNSMCGDEIKIYLIVKNNKIKELKYEGDSCIYCQASASLFSSIAKNHTLKGVNNFVEKSKFLFEKKIKFPDKKWKKFLKLINKKNFPRKDCILLPLKAANKAIKN